MPGTDNDSAINVHLCRNGVPGMSAAYENQTLVRLLNYVYRPLCFVLFFSSPPNHAEFRTWKLKTSLSQAKLFKPPEPISIIQKTFLPTGVS